MTVREYLRVRGSKWCSVQVELRDTDKGEELSITGSYGTVMTRNEAKRAALEYWISYFEEGSEYIEAFAMSQGEHFCNARQAAKYVLEVDGEFHGLDIHAQLDRRVYVLEGCGQILDELADFFPEVVPYLKWHLNGMRAGCQRQRQNLRGWEVGEKCGECGYAYGSQWLHEELPGSVVDWATNFEPDAAYGASKCLLA